MRIDKKTGARIYTQDEYDADVLKWKRIAAIISSGAAGEDERRGMKKELNERVNGLLERNG